jgi:hypothetical protein
MRLGTVSLLMLAFVCVAASMMLVPSYFAFSAELQDRKAELARVSTSLATSAEGEVGARLATLRDDVTHLSRLGTTPTGTAVVRAVLDVPRPGVRLTSFAYTPSAKPAENRLMLNGEAESRDALRKYNLALSQLPFVTRSELPISTYAKETDLPFTITLTGPLMP